MRPFRAARFRKVEQLIERAEEGGRFRADGANVRFRPEVVIRRHALDIAPHEANHAVMHLHVGTRLRLGGTARKSRQVLKTQGE